MHCPYCKNPRYNTGQKLGGHIKYCHAKPQPVATIYTAEELQDDELQIDLNDDAFADTFAYLSEEFISAQKKYLSEESIQNLHAGRVRLLSGDFGVADIRCYLEIAQYVSRCVALSAANASLLLLLIKRVSYINGSEIPLPQKYETLRDNILSSMEGKKAYILRVEFKLPTELYGNSALSASPCISVMSPMMDILKRYLLDDSIVGINCENFVPTARKEYRNGQRVFSDWTTGIYFEQYEKFVHDRWGDDTIVLLILMAADKCTTNRHGSESAYPAYMGLGPLELYNNHIHR
jgi:hypothetical protein